MERSGHDIGGAAGGGRPPAELRLPLDGRAGPARRLPSAAAAALVAAVLETTACSTPAPGALSRPGSTPPPPRWRRPLAVAAAVLFALSLGSGASAVALRLIRVELGAAELGPEDPAPPPHLGPRRPPGTAARPAPELEVPIPVDEPARARSAPPARSKLVRRGASALPQQRAPAPTAHPPVAVPEHAPPADLLAAANERRTRGAWREADAYYEAVTARFAGTDAAVVAEVASAALHLQHLGDPGRALGSYRRALELRPAGPLAEEARWGLAEAHRAAGDSGAEVLALQELLAHHPQSALAPAARQRLSRLAR